MEKSPSPAYGARLELVYGLIAHRGFESLLLRQEKEPAFELVLFLLSEKLRKGFERGCQSRSSVSTVTAVLFLLSIGSDYAGISSIQ